MMDGTTFREAGVLHRKLDGEDFWLLYSEDGKPWDGLGLPAAIHPVRGRACQLKRNEKGHPAAWEVAGYGGSRTIFPAASVVHFRDYDPDNPLRGLGDVEVLLRDLEIGFQAQRYMEAVVRNSGDPGGFIKLKGTVNKEEADAIEEAAEEAFRPEQRGRWKTVQGEDADLVPNSLSPKEMEFSKLFAWLRDKSASVLGVPLPVIGVLEKATYSNYSQAVAMFWKGGNGIVPYLRTVETGINAFFLPRVKEAQGLVARFDVSQIEALQSDRGEKIKIAERLKTKFPELSFNEIAAIVGLEIESVDVGDLRLVPGTPKTLDQVLAGVEEGAEAGGDEGGAEEEASAELELRESDPESEPEPDDAEAEAEAERSAYWDGIEERVYKPGEKAVAKSYRGWSKKYEAAQLKRLESYASEGEAGVKFQEFRRRPFSKDDFGPQFIAAELTEADIEILLVNRQEWADKMDDLLAPDFENVFTVAAEDLAAELGGIAIGSQDPEVLLFLSDQRIQLVEGHTSTLAKRVRSALLRVFSGNDNVATLQEHVRDNLPALTKELKRVFGTREARALAIARTETAHASNGARYMQMQRSGVETHQWITSGDQRVRGAPGTAPTDHSHYELDGREVALGETFARKLKFPSDPEADAGDVVNCRCITRAGKRTEEDQ